LVGHWDTDVFGVEHPVARTLKAELLIPVPSGAADISDLLNGGQDACPIIKVISVVAANASSRLIESVALRRNLNANSLGIEHPIVGALKTN
jgi:hypothetical protein